MRQDVRARELKAAGMDWTDLLAVEAENKRARLAAGLLASDAYGSTAERIEAFKQKAGGCRVPGDVFQLPAEWEWSRIEPAAGRVVAMVKSELPILNSAPGSMLGLPLF